MYITLSKYDFQAQYSWKRLKKNRQPHESRDINQESYKDQLQKCGTNK